MAGKNEPSTPAEEGAPAEVRPETGEGAGSPQDAPTRPLDEKELRRAEVRSFLGPAVQTPVGIPDGYSPNDRSIHPLFHIEVSHLNFVGPLDLLLYLIKRHDLDILDIPIAFLTDRYLEMLNTLRALDIDTAAEFLVLASELLHIKSKMLLPAEKGVSVDDPSHEEEAADPRAELVRRLLEYQKYRDAAGQLAKRAQLGRDVFPRVPSRMESADDLDPGLRQVNVFRLVELMARLLREVPVHHQIAYESFSIGERIQHITRFADTRGGRFTILSLMQTITSRGELVVTFIALLEMAKMGLARILAEVFHETGVDAFEVSPDGVAGAPGPAGKEAGAALASFESGTVEPAVEKASLPSAEGDLAAAQREAEALEALAREVEAEGPLGLEAIDVDALTGPAEAGADSLEPLPEIWVELKDKRFQGDLVDDYRS